MNHCSSPVDACRSPASVGSARLRTVRSSPTTSTLSASAPSAHHRRFSGLLVMVVTLFLWSPLSACYIYLRVTVKKLRAREAHGSRQDGNLRRRDGFTGNEMF